MKILVIDDNSEVIGEIEDLQDYDLDKPMASSSIIENIKDIIALEKK